MGLLNLVKWVQENPVLAIGLLGAALVSLPLAPKLIVVLLPYVVPAAALAIVSAPVVWIPCPHGLGLIPCTMSMLRVFCVHTGWTIPVISPAAKG